MLVLCNNYVSRVSILNGLLGVASLLLQRQHGLALAYVQPGSKNFLLHAPWHSGSLGGNPRCMGLPLDQRVIPNYGSGMMLSSVPL
jgi:hypothetical protein